MSVRAAGVALLLAGVVVIGLVLGLTGRAREGQSDERAGVAAASAVEGGDANSLAIRAPERPSLEPAPAQQRLPARPASADFDAEPRDEDWAGAREHAVSARLEEVLGDTGSIRVGEPECRSRRCRVSVSGTNRADFERYLEALQGPKGFYRRATRLMLADFHRDRDQSRVTVYLLYER